MCVRVCVCVCVCVRVCVCVCCCTGAAAVASELTQLTSVIAGMRTSVAGLEDHAKHTVSAHDLQALLGNLQPQISGQSVMITFAIYRMR